MPTALIYSPLFDGHRQMYVFVLANVLKELGFKIFIASDMHAQSDSKTYIEKIRIDYSITMVDTSIYPKGGLEISRVEFCELQNKLDIDLTIFTEADHHIELFIGQIPLKQKKLRGRIIGIFLRPFYFYDKPTLIEKLKYMKHLPSTWQSDERLFFDFFLKYFPLLDSILCLDENFVSKHSYSNWLPDVFQSYTENLLPLSHDSAETWITELDTFKKHNKGRFVFLYFGTAQYRRGYDTLLKMAVEHNGCFLHCGLRGNDIRLPVSVEELRSKLQTEGRFMETNEFIETPATIEAFFRSTTHLILPYKHFYGSSGVMIQALSYGIPVLVPENGVMGYRVKKYNLGMVFDEETPSSLNTQFEKFVHTTPLDFQNGISTFLDFQNTSALKTTLECAFSGLQKPINTP